MQKLKPKSNIEKNSTCRRRCYRQKFSIFREKFYARRRLSCNFSLAFNG